MILAAAMMALTLMVLACVRSSAADAPASTSPARAVDHRDFQPVPGFVPPKPGEHPRLLFRAGDVPTLRARAATPEGKLLVARLKAQLGGGEAMPTSFNPSQDGGRDGPNLYKQSAPLGAFTLWHAAGFAFLYQISGERRYADLARQCAERMLDGTLDLDSRYSYTESYNAMRSGAALQAMAMAYDMAYDGWDAKFRSRIIASIHDFPTNPKSTPTARIDALAEGKHHGPGSNHWGIQIAGPAFAVLAITGDPGVDQKRVDKWLQLSERNFVQQFSGGGFGDHGFYPEGDGCGVIPADQGLTGAMRAWRVAGGKDFVTPNTAVQWMTMRWTMAGTLQAGGGKPGFHIRGVYPNNVWRRRELSGSGHFAQGFGAILPEHRATLLWFYNRTFKAGDDDAGTPFDTVSPYPYHTIYAFLNWPFGEKERNPGEVLPRAVEDKRWGWYAFRDRWKDHEDIVVTMLVRRAQGKNKYFSAPSSVMTAGGTTAELPWNVHGDPAAFVAGAADGAVKTSTGSFGADFSGASGARSLLVFIGGQAGKGKSDRLITVAAGGNTYRAMVIGGEATPKADGDKLVVGGQVVSVKDGMIRFAR